MMIEKIIRLTSACSTRAMLGGYAAGLATDSNADRLNRERRMTVDHHPAVSLTRTDETRGWSEPYPEEVVVANAARGAGGVERHPEDMLTGRVRDVPGIEVHPVLPAAGIGNGNRSGLIDAVHLDVEHATGAQVRDPNPERIGAGRRDVDRVLQPFSGSRLHHVEPAAGIQRRLDIHVRCSIGVAAVARRRVEVGDRLSALVEVLSLHRTRERRRRSTERCRCRSTTARPAGRETPHWSAVHLLGPRPIDDAPEVGR